MLVAVFLFAMSSAAQEAVSSLGIFDTTSAKMFGSDGQMLEAAPELVSGRVEVTREDDDFVYDLYLDAKRAGIFSVSTQKSGSWCFSCKARWVNWESTGDIIYVGVNITYSNKRSDTLFLATKYPFGYLVNAGWIDADGNYQNVWGTYGVEKTHIVSNPEDGIYLRVIRIAPLGLFISEYSLDGIDWFLLHETTIEMYQGVEYSIELGGGNETHAHARLSHVSLQPIHAIAQRFVNSKWDAPGEKIGAILRVQNLETEPVSATVREFIPVDWMVQGITGGGVFQNGVITWQNVLPPGFSFLGYTLQSSTNADKRITFKGAVDSIPVLGETEGRKDTFDFRITYYTTLLVVPFVLLLLHLSLYIFYPRYIENLYNSLFLVCIMAMNYFLFERAFPTQNFNSVSNWNYFFICLTGMSVFLLLFFYSLAYSKLPIRYWLFLVGCLSTLFLAEWFQQRSFYLSLFFICIALTGIETVRTLGVLMKSRKGGIWIIVVGASIFIFSLLYVIIGYIFNFPPLPDYLSRTALLLFLVSISIYLSYCYARTNKELSSLTVDLENRVEQRTHELEQANNKLQTANENLLELDKMKSAFVSQASHDLRTPLTAIKGSLDNLVMGIAGDLNEKQKKIMERATRSVDRLSNLVNDVLDLNRIESGRIVLEKSDFSLTESVKSIIQENLPVAEQKHIQIKLNIHDDSCMISADAGKIERVMGELIGNAIKYTPEKGTIDITLSQDEQQITFSVKDSGIGMTREECDKIWERFYRTNASKTFAKGSGLGLSIAKELVEMHGGEMTVVSEVGKGTTFMLKMHIARH